MTDNINGQNGKRQTMFHKIIYWTLNIVKHEPH